MNRSTPPSPGSALQPDDRADAPGGPTSVETYWLVFLVAAHVPVGVLVRSWPHFWPMTLLVVPMVLAHLVLGPRNLPWFIVFVLAVLTGLASSTSTFVLSSRTVSLSR